MYRDPEKLRNRRVPVYLTAEEDRYLEALVDLIGGQKAVLARTLLVRQMRTAASELGATELDDEVLKAG